MAHSRLFLLSPLALIAGAAGRACGGALLGRSAGKPSVSPWPSPASTGWPTRTSRGPEAAAPGRRRAWGCATRGARCPSGSTTAATASWATATGSSSSAKRCRARPSYYNEHTSRNVYVLGTAETKPARMERGKAPASSAQPGPALPLEVRRHLEQDQVLLRLVGNQGMKQELWHWAKLTQIDPEPFEVKLDLSDLDVASERPVRIRLDFRGWSLPGPASHAGHQGPPGRGERERPRGRQRRVEQRGPGAPARAARDRALHRHAGRHERADPGAAPSRSAGHGFAGRRLGPELGPGRLSARVEPARPTGARPRGGRWVLAARHQHERLRPPRLRRRRHPLGREGPGARVGRRVVDGPARREAVRPRPGRRVHAAVFDREGPAVATSRTRRARPTT